MQEQLQSSLLKVWEYIGIGWLEFAKNLKTFLIFTLVVNLPTALLKLFVQISVKPEIRDLQSILGLAVAVNLIVIISSMWTTLATAKVIERSLRGQTLDALTALKNTAPKLLVALVVSILIAIITTLGLIAFIIPGICLAVRYSFAIYAIALRDCGLNAMDYSQSVVRDRWWDVFGRSVLIGLFLSVLLFILQAPMDFSAEIMGSLGLGRLEEVGSDLVSTFIGYFAITIFTVLFLNFDYTRYPPA